MSKMQHKVNFYAEYAWFEIYTSPKPIIRLNTLFFPTLYS